MSLFSKMLTVGLALGVCFGADYYNQASRAGASPSTFGAEDYVGSVQDRFHEYVNDEARDKLPLVAFLPEPTGSWEKQPWSGALESILEGGKTSDASRALMIEQMEQESAQIGGLFRMDLMAGFAKKSRNTVYFHRGSEIIEITIRETGDGGLHAGQQAAMDIALSNMDGMSDREVFARIRGVRYIQSNGMMAWDATPKDDWDRMKTISGQFGDIKISIRAKARSGSVKTLLARIDYDGILASLDEEVKGVGNQVVNSLPQIKDRSYKAVEMKRLSAESSDKAESAWDRFLALFGMARETPEDTRSVVVHRGNATSSCNGLARDCGGKMSTQIGF